jgi:hypothetical protein
MLKKPMAAAMLLAGAAGGPYVLYETDAGQTALSTANQVLGTSPATGSDDLVPGKLISAVNATTQSGSAQSSSWWNPFVAASPTSPAGTPASGPEYVVTQINSLSEVLRFDISPAWVIQHFPRVNTGLAELQLDGMRVPLITGTRPDDIVGSLTYYFDHFQRVQRITMQGVTGDPTRLGNELQRNYRMQQQPALGGGLYTINWNGQPTSILHIAPAALITVEQQTARFELYLELNQPGLQYGLSPQSQRLLQTGKQTQRW